METIAMQPRGGGQEGRKHVDGKSKTQESATNAARGAKGNYTTEKAKNHMVLCLKAW